MLIVKLGGGSPTYSEVKSILDAVWVIGLKNHPKVVFGLQTSLKLFINSLQSKLYYGD